jgi:hypothetical protein
VSWEEVSSHSISEKLEGKNNRLRTWLSSSTAIFHDFPRDFLSAPSPLKDAV